MVTQLPVAIGNTEITPLFYKNQPIITLAMIDIVHNRPDGTARKAFNRNQDRLLEGDDYFVLLTDEAKDEFNITAPNGLIIFTETGYLLLVKVFTDQLAWKIQRQLVKIYFAVKQDTQLPAPRAKKAIKGGLLLEQQDAINDFIKERVANVPREKRAAGAIRIYSAINTKFGTKGMKDGYKNIAAEHFDNVMQLIARLPLEGEWLPHDQTAPGPTLDQIAALIDQKLSAHRALETLPAPTAAQTKDHVCGVHYPPVQLGDVRLLSDVSLRSLNSQLAHQGYQIVKL